MCGLSLGSLCHSRVSLYSSIQLTESLRRFAAAQSRCFGMAAGELQPLDKSLTPRSNVGSKSGLSLPSKFLSRFGTSGAPSSANGASSTKNDSTPVHQLASLDINRGGDGAGKSAFTENVTNSDGTWGAPVLDYNPFS